MTPREYDLEARAAEQRWQDESDRDLTQAWHVAVFYSQVKVGKLVALDEALARNRGESTRQTTDQQLRVLRMLSKQTGFPLRTVH